jgi:RND family efflux transporter MFP subunit
MKQRKKHPIKSIIRLLFGTVFGVLLPLVLIAAGGVGALYLLRTPPQAERSKNTARQQQARLVEVQEHWETDRVVEVEVMGTVKPARSVALQAQVGGRVIAVNENLVVGGLLPEGTMAVRIDPSDYELAVRQRQSDVAQAESDLQIEMGQQEIARQEFELLGEKIPQQESSLALRRPQLEKARAKLEAARTALENAKLDLSRTTVQIPFNSLVLSESIERGTIVSAQTQLAHLVGTDQYWVELSVPVDDLRFILLPGVDGQQGSEVYLYDTAAWGDGVSRVGHVIRSSGVVDEESRMSRVIVAVDDPLSIQPENQGQPQVLMNSYLRAEIVGKKLENIVPLAREYLHEGNSIWVMNEENQLEIRPVEIAWRGPKEVLILSGIKDGELVVTSRLASPVEGMSLRTYSGQDQLEEQAPSELRLDKRENPVEAQVQKSGGAGGKVSG